MVSEKSPSVPLGVGAVRLWIHSGQVRVRRLDEIKKLEGQKMVTAFDTWKCHICGEERPDAKISVVTKPLIINGQACVEQNIRYCNDRPACIEGAKEFSFFKEE